LFKVYQILLLIFMREKMKKKGKKELILIFKIALPFWIDMPDKFLLEKKLKRRKYSIEIRQDLWQVNFSSEFQKVSFLIQEDAVLNRSFLQPRRKFDDLNLVDLTQEKEYEEDWQYISNKVKTMLFIEVLLPFMDSNDKIMKYVKEKNIWGEVKDLINYFISLYTYIRINSNHKYCPIYPLGNDYYNSENTIISYKLKPDSSEIHIEKTNLFLKIPYHYNYHTLFAEEGTLDFFKERFSRNRDFKFKLDERMEISIEFARRLRDSNLMIINTCIYLERISIEYLSHKKEIDKSELSILYKEKGLTYYVECQLPLFLKDDIDPELINDAIEIVRLRNQIIHYGANFPFHNDYVSKCDNGLKLIKILETFIKPEREKIEFKFKGKIVGRVVEIGPENLLLLSQFESELEANYNLRNEILLSKISEKIVRDFAKISEDFKLFQLPGEFKAYCMIFFQDEHYITIFALNPTQNNMNFKFLDTILIYIQNNINLEKLSIYFITQHIPTGKLNLFKKVTEKKLENFKEELKINLEFGYYSFIIFSDSKKQELFMKISEIFNTKEDSMIDEEEILKYFEKEEIEDLFRYYPDFFQKKQIGEKISWVMHGKLKDIKSII